MTPLFMLGHLLPLTKNFGEISVFAINPTKTELYPVGLTGVTCTEIQSLHNFKWVTTTWRHLGVLVPLHLKDLFKVNYILLFKKIKAYCIIGLPSCLPGWSKSNW